MLWGWLRFVAGVLSAAMFVLGTEMVMQSLRASEAWKIPGIHFSGVGWGIALSGLLVPVFNLAGGWQGAWLGVAGVSLLLGLPCLRWLEDHGHAPAPDSDAVPETSTGYPVWVIGAAYTLFGYGYIVSGTFLVAILKSASAAASDGGFAGLGDMAWVLVGLAAAPSCYLWMWVARRTGFVTALVLAHLIQAAGIVLPVFSVALPVVVASALLYGGTAMGIVTLAVTFGRQEARRNKKQVVGVLTGFFGIGQIAGPLVAGEMMAAQGSFDLPLLQAAAVMVLGALLLPAGRLPALIRRAGQRPAR